VVAEWLGAKYYISGYRPIPIEEYLVYQNSIYPIANAERLCRHVAANLDSQDGSKDAARPCRRIATSTHGEFKDPVANAVVALTIETVMSGFGALVFCSSRQGAQNMASLIAEAIPAESIPASVRDRRMDLIASLQALPDGFEPALAHTLVYGVAFHHAGLTSEERDLVAEAYDQGVLRAMVATCSLAAGINLPARRVILKGARMGRDLVGPAMLRQMRGRAGRKGKDEVGETFLCCQTADLEAVVGLLEAEMPAVESCLKPEKRGVKRALLEVIGTQLATSRQSMEEYVKRSLLFCTADDIPSVWLMVEEAMQDLLTTGLIRSTGVDCFEPSRLGQAIIASSLTPEDGLFVHDELRKALQCFVMDGEMHLFYLFTPVQASSLSSVSWRIFRDQMEELDESGMRALRCIGVNPALVNSLVNSGATMKENTSEEINRARRYRRVFAAFQLRDLCNEMEVHKVSARYSVVRGMVQALAQSCHGFAAGMVKFSERMGWGMLAAVLEHMVDRLRAGARADLLEMAQVTHVKSRMARMLWENGFKSVQALAEAEATDIVPVMMLAQRKKLGQEEGEGREKLMQTMGRKAEMMIGSANKIWERQQVVELDD
jgi:replicative superfamily II helicase